jgi:hypothetical protein
MIKINDLPLPRELLELIDAGRWQCPQDQSKVNLVFPDRVELKLYSIEYMPIENKHWLNETKPMFVGVPDSEIPPGDIDPHLSILIGDLGLGSDQPIALDYRLSLDCPRVLTLQWSCDETPNRWVEIAPNVRVFSELLGF